MSSKSRASAYLWKEKKNTKEEFTKQDIKKQNEKKTASANEACEKQKSESENEKKSQVQNHNKIITNEHTRQRKLIIHAQSSTTFASFEKSKKNRMTNSAENEDFSNKRQKRFMIVNEESSKRKNISHFDKNNICRSFNSSTVCVKLFKLWTDWMFIFRLHQFFDDIRYFWSFFDCVLASRSYHFLILKF